MPLPRVQLPARGSSRSLSPIPGSRSRAIAARLRAEAAKPAIVLVPARAFIGIGWLRACAEKVGEPGWRDGSSLTAFLADRLADGSVSFPLYRQAIESAFIPHAAVLGIVVVVGQFLAGAAILAGGFTNAALLGALFMNANFLLAGAPNPSAFYVVVQAALLAAQAGAVLGVDAELSASIRNPYLVAQPPGRGAVGRGFFAATAAGCLLATVVALAHVGDWSAAGSVHDPAMVVAMLAWLGVAWAAIGWLRLDPSSPPTRHPRGHRLWFDLDAALAGQPLGDPRRIPAAAFRRDPTDAEAVPDRRWAAEPCRSVSDDTWPEPPEFAPIGASGLPRPDPLLPGRST